MYFVTFRALRLAQRNDYMKSNYFEQLEARKTRYHELAEKNNHLASQLSNQVTKMAHCIPLGQPILVGHHSEGSDRRFRNRIHQTMHNSLKAAEKSSYYEEKAKSIENNTSISSDNPNAIQLLQEKICKLEELQERMKSANKLIKKGDRERLLKLGYNEKDVDLLFTPNCFGQIGYPSFTLSNNRQVITNAKKRLANLEKQETEETTENSFTTIGLKIIDNVEDNRLQLYFDNKPSEKIREELTSNTFKWCKALGCWQQFRSPRANHKAENIIQLLIRENHKGDELKND